MRAMARPQLGRALGPAGDDLAAARHRDAVVEAEVALLLAHAAPVRGAEWRIHCRIHLVVMAGTMPAIPLCGKMVYTALSSAIDQKMRIGAET
jgi:hypothetical protein